MCGIVGYVGQAAASEILLPALRRLEYRGYDSAGITTLNGHGLETCKVVGKVAALEARLTTPPGGRLGIAHTRWATHGRPSTANAHPHLDCHGRVALVHNGIIENYREIKQRLIALGHRFRSDTDSEVIVHLIEHHRRGGFVDAVDRAARELRGAFAIACIDAGAPATLVGARRGSSPLVIGRSATGWLVASDEAALLGRADRMVVLDDGDLAAMTPEGLTIRTLGGGEVARPSVAVTADAETAERGDYPHFMLKEIFEQPAAVGRTLHDRLDVERERVEIPELGVSDDELAAVRRLTFIACGSSYHAALVARYVIESLARVPVDADIASEFRHRAPSLDRRVLTVPISQSGETADTLAALRQAKAAGSRAVAICNVAGSSVARESDGLIHTRAGLEIGVAATKTFTTQLAAILLLALKLGEVRGALDPATRRALLRELRAAPEGMAAALAACHGVRAHARRLSRRPTALFIGRGLQYPLALEGALKLKEISYIHAEGYAAGEMKHGPIALIDRRVPVVAIAPDDDTYDKMVNNIEEIKARDGFVLALTTGDDDLAERVDGVIAMPRVAPWIQPLIVAVPLQLLAYHAALARRCDVDRPRNLAKSVTVE